MKRKRRELIFRATIEYGYEQRKQGRYLRLNNNELSPQNLEHELRSIIITQLPNELQKIYGMTIDARLIEIQSGSIIVFFGAAITAFNLISNYSDFYESAKLIREHSQLLIQRMMYERYGEEFDVSIAEQYPALPDPDMIHPWWRIKKMFGKEFDDIMYHSAWMNYSSSSNTRRDGLFWFLLVFNILLLTALIILVWGAVAKTYF